VQSFSTSAMTKQMMTRHSNELATSSTESQDACSAAAPPDPSPNRTDL
jgi:hypothetical protein